MEELEQGAVVFGAGVVGDAQLIAAAVEDGHLAVLFDEFRVGGVDFIDVGILARERTVVVVGEENRTQAFLPVDEIFGTRDACVVVPCAGLFILELVDVCHVEIAVLREVVKRRAADVFFVAVNRLFKKLPMDEIGGFEEKEREGNEAFVVCLEQHDMAFAVEGDRRVEDMSMWIMENWRGVAPMEEIFGDGHVDGVRRPCSVVSDIGAVAVAFAVGDVGEDEIMPVQNMGQFAVGFIVDDDGVIGLAFRLRAVDGRDVEEADVSSFKGERRRFADVAFEMTDMMPDGSIHDDDSKILELKWMVMGCSHSPSCICGIWTIIERQVAFARKMLSL